MLGSSGMHGDVAALARADGVTVAPGDGAAGGVAGHADAGVVLLRCRTRVPGTGCRCLRGELGRELVVNLRGPGRAAVEGDVGAAVVGPDRTADFVVGIDPEVVIVAEVGGDLGKNSAAAGGTFHMLKLLNRRPSGFRVSAKTCM